MLKKLEIKFKKVQKFILKFKNIQNIAQKC